MKKNHRILVVEDSKYMNKVITKTLQNYGYDCSSVLDYESAKDILSHKVFDFIILDLNLPDAFGIDLVDGIIDKTDAKIFIFTSEIDIELREVLFRKGILDYLVKDKYFVDSIASIDHTIQSIEENNLKTVLVIDDSKFICHEVKKVLSVRNYNVLSAYNAKNGFDILLHNDINTIVLDMELPDKHGLDVLRDLKKMDSTKEIPVVVLSSSIDREVVRKCIKLGSSDFIQKPFNVEEFVLKIAMAVTTNTHNNELNQIRKKLEKDLDKTSFVANEYLEAINESNILAHTNEQNIIVDINERYRDISGYKREEIVGQVASKFIAKDSATHYTEEIKNQLKEFRIFRGILPNIKKDGSIYYTQTSIMPILNPQGKILEYLWMSTDITTSINYASEIEETQRSLLYRVGELGESRSKETGQHVKRVAECSKLLAQLYGMDDKDVDILYRASPMHDIGKIAIPDKILKKPAKLDADEWEIMMTHSQLGADVFKNSDKALFKVASTIALTHHEKWNGSGYPQGISGEDIPIVGRIVAIADVFDALSSKRVYKGAWNDEKIKNYFQEHSGTQFDPHLTSLFLDNYDSFLKIRNINKD